MQIQNDLPPELDSFMQNLTASLIDLSNAFMLAFAPLAEIMNNEGVKQLIEIISESEKITTAIDTAESFIDFLEKLKTAFNIEYDQELAKLLNIRIDQLSLLLSGRRLPNTRYLDIIFKALNIQPDSQPFYRLLALSHKARLKE